MPYTTRLDDTLTSTYIILNTRNDIIATCVSEFQATLISEALNAQENSKDRLAREEDLRVRIARLENLIRTYITCQQLMFDEINTQEEPT